MQFPSTVYAENVVHLFCMYGQFRTVSGAICNERRAVVQHGLKKLLMQLNFPSKIVVLISQLSLFAN